VIGWEHVPPEFGRPQAIINPRVDECDIFVGILNRRWGTPTGVAESGFYEEYERAATRRRDGAVPSMAVYFKDIPAEAVEDPGDELKKVLSFKRNLSETNTALYVRFDSPKDLELKVWQYFVQQTVQPDLTEISESPQGTRDDPEGADPPAALDIGDDTEPDAAKAQIGDTLEQWIRLSRGLTPASPDADRLLLFALAFSDGGGPLRPHVAYRLFRRHEDLELSAAEHGLWLRSILMDIAGSRATGWGRVIPGWAVLVHVPAFHLSLEAELAALASSDDASVGSGALVLLRQLAARPQALWSMADDADPATGASRERATIQRWMTLFSDEQSRSSAVEYIAAAVSPEDLPLIRALEEVTHDEALREIGDLLAGDASALAAAVGSAYSVTHWRVELLSGAVESASTESLSTVVLGKSTPQHLRRRAFVELLHRDELDPTIIGGLLKEADLADDLFELVKDGRLTPDAIDQALAVLDNSLIEVDLRARLLALRASVPDLLARVESDSIPIDAWEALGWVESPSDELHMVARRIFDTDGEDLVGRLRAVGEWEGKERVFRYMQDRARSAALRIIARMRPLDEEDLVRLRSEVSRDSLLTRGAALELLALAGEPGDALTLTQGRMSLIGEARRRIAIRALDLDVAVAGRAMLLEGERAEKLLALSRLDVEGKLSVEELFDLLYSEDGPVRVAAVGVLSARLTKSELAAMLDDYHTAAGSRMYFYNVVVEFDRILFAPPPLASLAVEPPLA